MLRHSGLAFKLKFRWFRVRQQPSQPTSSCDSWPSGGSGCRRGCWCGWAHAATSTWYLASALLFRFYGRAQEPKVQVGMHPVIFLCSEQCGVFIAFVRFVRLFQQSMLLACANPHTHRHRQRERERERHVHTDGHSLLAYTLFFTTSCTVLLAAA